MFSFLAQGLPPFQFPRVVVYAKSHFRCLSFRSIVNFIFLSLTCSLLLQLLTSSQTGSLSHLYFNLPCSPLKAHSKSISALDFLSYARASNCQLSQHKLSFLLLAALSFSLINSLWALICNCFQLLKPILYTYFPRGQYLASIFYRNAVIY